MPQDQQIAVADIAISSAWAIVGILIALVALGISIWSVVVTKQTANQQRTDSAALNALQTKFYASMAAPRINFSWLRGNDHTLWLENAGNIEMRKVRLTATYVKNGENALRIDRPLIERVPAGQKEEFKTYGAQPVKVVIKWKDPEGTEHNDEREVSA
ncbi:MAG: hypothetical protein Q8O67_17095 [Deltaproteobacteria bacterium]|nr:hypothetical protein [Deltaproteobacteria bacterium]